MFEFFAWSNPFMYVAFVWAAFFGLRAVSIFIDHGPVGERDQQGDHRGDYYLQKKRHKDWRIYQFIYNASGAFLGWMVLYFIVDVPINCYGITHYIGLFIAFLGITGNLPYFASRLQKLM